MGSYEEFKKNEEEIKKVLTDAFLEAFSYLESKGVNLKDLP